MADDVRASRPRPDAGPVRRAVVDDHDGGDLRPAGERGHGRGDAIGLVLRGDDDSDPRPGWAFLDHDGSLDQRRLSAASVGG
jgi:hypothetical protein